MGIEIPAGEIPVDVMRYREGELDEFRRGRGPLRILHPRIKVHDGHRTHRFAEAFVAHTLEHERGWQCWAGTCKVFRDPSPNTRRFTQTAIVRELFMNCGLDPRELQARVTRFRLCGPDVLGFDPEAKRWHFREVKRLGDSLHRRPEQVLSLATINYFGLGDARIVRLVPEGSRVDDRPFPYTAFRCA